MSQSKSSLKESKIPKWRIILVWVLIVFFVGFCGLYIWRACYPIQTPTATYTPTSTNTLIPATFTPTLTIKPTQEPTKTPVLVTNTPIPPTKTVRPTSTRKPTNTPVPAKVGCNCWGTDEYFELHPGCVGICSYTKDD